MGAHGPGAQLAAELRDAEGFQGDRVELVGDGILAQGEELAVVDPAGGVAGVVAIGPRRRGIVGMGVAIGAIEPPAGLAFQQEALGLHIALDEIDIAVLEMEGGHHPVAVIEVVVLQGRIEGVAAAAVEAAVQLLRNLAYHLAVIDLRLEAKRRHCRMEVALDRDESVSAEADDGLVHELPPGLVRGLRSDDRRRMPRQRMV